MLRAPPDCVPTAAYGLEPRKGDRDPTDAASTRSLTALVCLPGMGDLRSEYRFLVPQLVDAGFRVVTLDLRGHGESDATFADHERATVGDDLVALLEELDAGPAHVIGTSFGAAAAVWAAAHAPERVASLTLDRLRGEVVLVEGAGHYPHAERPDTAGPAIVGFLSGLRTNAG